MPPQRSTLRQFLDGLFHGAEGLVDLRAIRGTRVSQAFYSLEDYDGIEAFVDLFEDHDLYFGVSTRRDATSGALENLAMLPALFVDIDFALTPEADVLTRVRDFPLPPSASVHSGGGLHLYWCLREPLVFPEDTDRAACLLRRLCATLRGDMSAAEPARVLRLPTTVNLKYQPARSVIWES
jgi:hypothetical protein